MKKIPRLLSACCLLVSVLCFSSGCESLSDFKEDNPVAYNIGKAVAQGALYVAVADLTDDPLEQAALRAMIKTAFVEGATADQVAQALAQGGAQLYANDPAAQEILRLTFADALQASGSSPAAGPEADFSLQLASALSQPVALNAPHSSLPTAAASQPYQPGTLYQPPAWASAKWGNHWSDRLWHATAFFSGCQDYANFRAWHATPLHPDTRQQIDAREI